MDTCFYAYYAFHVNLIWCIILWCFILYYCILLVSFFIFYVWTSLLKQHQKPSMSSPKKQHVWTCLMSVLMSVNFQKSRLWKILTKRHIIEKCHTGRIKVVVRKYVRSIVLLFILLLFHFKLLLSFTYSHYCFISENKPNKYRRQELKLLMYWMKI